MSSDTQRIITNTYRTIPNISAFEFRSTHKHMYYQVGAIWRTLRTQTSLVMEQINEHTVMTEKAEILHCACSSTEHTVIYHHNVDDNEVYMHTHLAKLGLFERIWYALKYVFGHQSNYGAFEEHILGPDQIPQLRELADRIEECQKENIRRAAEQW